MSSQKKQPPPARRTQGGASAQSGASPSAPSDDDLEALTRALLQKRPRSTMLSDEVVSYDKKWLREDNAQRKAEGLPPLRQHKRNAVERERLRALCMVVSPMAAADINPDYQLIEEEPATRQPQRERARRALSPRKARIRLVSLRNMLRRWARPRTARPWYR